MVHHAELVFLLLVGCGTDPSTVTDRPATPSDTATTATTSPPIPQLTATVEPRVLRVTPGRRVPIFVALGGDPVPDDGSVSLRLVGLPPGVTAAPVEVGSTAVEIGIDVATDAQLGGPFVVELESTAAELEAEALRLYVAGPPGTPDPSFGVDGLVTWDPTVGLDTLPTLGIDEHRHLWVGGSGSSGWVLRARLDGSLDPDFAEAGVLPGLGVASAGLAIRPAGGALLVVGYDDPIRLELTALDPGGAVDPAFGTDGVVEVPDADVVLAHLDGWLLTGFFGGLRRYDASGLVDPVFVDGRTTVTSPTDTRIDAEGRILVAGRQQLQVVERLLPTGAPDGAFGVGGVSEAIPIPPDRAPGGIARLALSQDGVLYAFGEMEALEPVGYAERFRYLTRILPNGSVDRSFGDDGLQLLDVSDVLLAEVVGQRLVVVVSVESDGGPQTHELRAYELDGELDATFADAGRLPIPLGGVWNGQHMVVDDEGGRLVVVWSWFSGLSDQGIPALRVWL